MSFIYPMWMYYGGYPPDIDMFPEYKYEFSLIEKGKKSRFVDEAYRTMR